MLVSRPRIVIELFCGDILVDEVTLPGHLNSQALELDSIGCLPDDHFEVLEPRLLLIHLKTSKVVQGVGLLLREVGVEAPALSEHLRVQSCHFRFSHNEFCHDYRVVHHRQDLAHLNLVENIHRETLEVAVDNRGDDRLSGFDDSDADEVLRASALPYE